MDGRLRINGASLAVKVRLVGAQFQETASVNEGESTATGFEIVSYVANENLRFDGFLGLLDHEYDSYSMVL